MEIKEFALKVQRAIAEKMGEGYQVRLQEVQKNNNVVLQGLLIVSEKQNVAPTIYLNSFWEAYEAGVPFSAVVEKILQIYAEDTPEENVDLSFFKDFDKVKERICYRLISAGRNQELLAKIPHLEYLDLAICFYYAYQGEALGSGSILIHNTHLEMWQASTKRLFELAQANTPELFPWEYSSLEDVIFQMAEEEQGSDMNDSVKDVIEEAKEQEFFKRMPVQVLSNESKVHGASCILYPGLLRQLAGANNLYIIPSSIHEVILLPCSCRIDPDGLRKMIKEVNDTQVGPEEILSDQLYCFDHLSGQVSIV